MKKYIIWIIAVLAVLVALYVYSEYNRKPQSAVDASAHIVSAEELMKQFLSNDSLADTQYKNKVLEINGMISSIENESSTILIFGSTGSSIRCSMDKMTTLDDRSNVTVKGFYTGYNKDELLGTDILLNRCVVVKE